MSEADASIIVGKPVLLVGYDEDGRAELHFDDGFDTLGPRRMTELS